MLFDVVHYFHRTCTSIISVLRCDTFTKVIDKEYENGAVKVIIETFVSLLF